MFVFKLAFLAVSASFFLAAASVALAGFLVLSGSPAACVDRALEPAPGATASLQANWLDALQRVESGETVALSVTEQQGASIGAMYLEQHDVPVEDFRLYFCPDGTAEATGRLTALGLGSNVLVRGHLVTEGAVRVEIDSVEVGNLPGFVAESIVELLFDEEDVLTLPLVVAVSTVQVSDGEAIVTVSAP